MIKTKSRSTEIEVIYDTTFYQIIEKLNLSSNKLTITDKLELQECVQLTPKYPNIYTITLLKILIQEIGADHKEV